MQCNQFIQHTDSYRKKVFKWPFIYEFFLHNKIKESSFYTTEKLKWCVSPALTAEDVDYSKLFRSWLTEEEHAPLPSYESRNKQKKEQKEMTLSDLCSLCTSVLTAVCLTCYFWLNAKGTHCQCNIRALGTLLITLGAGRPELCSSMLRIFGTNNAKMTSCLQRETKAGKAVSEICSLVAA